MAKIHDKYVIELAEVIKGYGNDPDVEDPFELSLFYRFYELPNIAIQRENFLKMKPLETRKGKWIDDGLYSDNFPHHAWHCSECGEDVIEIDTPWFKFCPNCGADMRGDSNAAD